MKPVTEPILCAAASAFDFGGPMVCDPHHYGEGHINDTFVVWQADHTKRFILQRMHTAEKRSLAWGAKLMTLECGIRLLTDYLEGDHYFHIARPNHNLDRARTQFTLVRQMEDVFDQMTAIVCPETDL